MHPPVSAERWAAIRALREGEPPIFPLLAVATGLHVTTIRERASRDDWEKQRFPKKGVAGRSLAPLPPELPEAGQDVRLEDLRQRLADVLPRQLGQIIALAERGIVDKARIDGLLSMGRILERSEALAQERAVEQQKRSDDELAAMLERIDDRIVELAEAYAQGLVGAQDRHGTG